MNRLLDSFRVAVTAIMAHKLRSSLTLLGVVIGVATIVTVVSTISGLNGYVRDKIFTLSPDVYIVSKFGIITNPDEFFRALRRKDMTVAESERLKELCEGCRDVGATVQGVTACKAGANRLPDVPMFGATANLVDLYNLDVEEGRFFTDSEARRSSPVAVIGSDVRDELFPKVDPVGRVMTVDGYPVKIVGVLRQQGSVLGQSQDAVVWMPIKLYEKVFGRNRSVDIWVQAPSLAQIEESQAEVSMLIRRMRDTPFRSEDPFGIVTAETLQMLWQGISAAAFAMMVLIAGISLVVGGIVIMNIMLVSVSQRTHEIGLRASVGARRRDILLQFLLEAGLLAAGGGAIGVLIGGGVALAVDTFSPFPTLVRPALVIVAMVVATLVGVVFGLWPAWKAARLDPIEALRSD